MTAHDSTAGPPVDPGALAVGGPTYRPWLAGALRPLVFAVARILFRLQVKGRHNVPSVGPVLIVGNHEGLLDGPLVAAVAGRNVRALAKARLFRGVGGSLLHLVGQIPVHRGRPDRAALRCAGAVLARGGVLAVFPEGTRGAGTADQIQDGAAYVLLHCGLTEVLVLPVQCIGTTKAMPRGARLPVLRAPITINFGVAERIEIPVNRHGRSQVRELSEKLRSVLASHLAAPSGGAAKVDMSAQEEPGSTAARKHVAAGDVA